ncbi:MAG: type II toxin-antitoxin system RelB/DinJ family antitoxin [Oscillospiraceae bacterium]|nr:type II toxin-antitoxin system RelB/DinJ family antitoxin [Oscillospiraceae bacterium]
MTSQISAKVSAEYKIMFNHTCERIGISPSTAINMFVKRMALTDAFPFDINEKIDIPNETTLAAFKESEEIIKNNPEPGFSSIEEMRRSMDLENEREDKT